MSSQWLNTFVNRLLGHVRPMTLVKATISYEPIHFYSSHVLILSCTLDSAGGNAIPSDHEVLLVRPPV